MAGVKKEERREDRKFVAFPPETVQIIGESVGVPNVAPAVAAALSEDASYRARELAHICSQLLRHSKRKKLTPEDMNHALRLFDAQPVYGHETAPAGGGPGGFVNLREVDVYAEDEGPALDLAAIALATPPPPSSPSASSLTLQASWLSLEGKAVDASSSSRTFDDFPHQGNLPPALVQYYTSLITVVLGDNEKHVSIMLEDLATNPKISPLIPFLVTFLRSGIQKHSDNQVLLDRMIGILESLFLNKYLNLSPKPYLNYLATAILSTLWKDRSSPSTVPTGGPNKPSGVQQQRQPVLHQQNGHHVNGSAGDVYTEMKITHVPRAAHILKLALNRWATPINLLRSQTLKAMVTQLTNQEISLASHYGALYAMIVLGPEVLVECLLPHLDAYVAFLDFQLSKAAPDPPAERERLRRKVELMRGTLLEAARKIVAHLSRRHGGIGFASEEHRRRQQIYSQLYAHFGDAINCQGTQFCVANVRSFEQASDSVVAGKMKLRSIGKKLDNGGGGGSGGIFLHRLAAPASAAERNNFVRMEAADSSLPNDIFEPTDASPEKTASSTAAAATASSSKAAATPRKLSDQVLAAFETSGGATQTVDQPRLVTVRAGGSILLSWPRDRLRSKVFSTSMPAFDARTAPPATRYPLVVGRRRGDMKAVYRRKRTLDSKPRTVALML